MKTHVSVHINYGGLFNVYQDCLPACETRIAPDEEEQSYVFTLRDTAIIPGWDTLLPEMRQEVLRGFCEHVEHLLSRPNPAAPVEEIEPNIIRIEGSAHLSEPATQTFIGDGERQDFQFNGGNPVAWLDACTVAGVVPALGVHHIDYATSVLHFATPPAYGDTIAITYRYEAPILRHSKTAAHPAVHGLSRAQVRALAHDVANEIAAQTRRHLLGR